MAQQFSYVARDRQGNKKSGVIQAETKQSVRSILRERGLRALEVQEKKQTIWNTDIYIGNPVKLSDFVIFLRQFATLIKAGVTIVDSVRILIEQTESKVLKKTLAQVENDLREGNSLSASFQKHPKVFSALFTNMIRAGEVSGSLEETLEEMADFFEKQHKTKEKVKSALSYPIVVGLLAIGVVIFLLISIVPTFVNMFDQFGGEVPAVTQFVITTSDWMIQYWYILILLLLAFIVSILLIRQNKETKIYLDYILLKMPIFGKLMRKSILARISRTLSSLLKNSVPILEAMTLTEKVIENQVIAKVLRESRTTLERGRSLTDPMADHWAFPPLVTQMITVGEQTGSLDQMLGRIADFYESEVETATDQMKSLIEPLMIILLAGVVGFIVLSIMVPMFEMFQNVN
ncbi:type II secretion system F family protein [Virgibacillus sp. MSP4-1]|uniref:type II secretion system F family protein n=1 Tax=Virgibacillus sp. MSP4-1 TaxID=2700081 RepID=UPI0003AA4150|nr:type II secretion system F family protein [Virgibacillus sp. MSP4-1]QHS24269.1 type II secretion system F family protein [Virgibacillus sp. MSP4-1]